MGQPSNPLRHELDALDRLAQMRLFSDAALQGRILPEVAADVIEAQLDCLRRALKAATLITRRVV